MENEIEVAINTEFGGFHITKEMAHWLRDNKNWIISESDDDWDNKDIDLYRLSHDYYHSGKHEINSIKFRSNKDLIECIKIIQEANQDKTYFEKSKLYIFNLKIEKFKFVVEIEDYYDGKERVSGYLKEL